MPLPWRGRLDSHGQSHATITVFRSRWVLLACFTIWVTLANAMTAARIAELRQETVEMFYHGFDNYMSVAFPEDEVRTLHNSGFVNIDIHS
jgi:hypothetical protein